MDKLLKNKKLLIFIGIVLVIIIVVYFLKSTERNDTTVLFNCKDSKSITARFDLKNDKGVDLKLSDGRVMFLPHAISADGAKYTNQEESIVFWNRGNTAFITEGRGSSVTFEDCVIDGGMALR